jgi:hypothetical protein
VVATSVVTIKVFAVEKPSPAANEELGLPFVEWGKLSSAQKEMTRRAFNASTTFKLDGGVNCTGTFISNTGHLLTALHCVASCLQRGGAVERSLALEEPVKLERYRSTPNGPIKTRKVYAYKFSVDDERLSANDLICPGLLGNQRQDFKIVLAGGKGWLAPKNALAEFSKRQPAAYRSLLDEGYEHDTDFAVLEATGYKNKSCLQLAADGPAENEKLQAIAYACVDRAEIKAEGQTALYSRGRKTNGFRESEYFKARSPKGLEFDSSVLERRDIFFSSLDMEKCGSGTAVLDERFNVRGVATRIYKTFDRFEKGSLESVSSARIWRELKAKKVESEWRKLVCDPQPPTHDQRRPTRSEASQPSKNPPSNL